VAQRTEVGGAGGLVVFCAGTPWDGVRGSDQQLALHLSAHRRVLYVDPPLSARTAWARRRAGHRAGLRPLGPRLDRLTVVVPPGPNRPGVRGLASAMARRAIGRAARRLDGPVDATVLASLDDLFWRDGGRRVLYVTDDFRAGATLMGLDPARVARWEEARAAEADLVVAVSPVLVEQWQARHDDVVLVPNGCDAEALAATDEVPPAGDVDLPPPIAGFVGNISSRIDLRMLRAVADRGVSLLVVGPAPPAFEAEVQAALRGPNVARVGYRPYDEVRSYLRLIDVGLVPYVDDDFNRASFPLKALELLAAGRAVVSTDLPAIRWLGSPDVDCEREPQAFADAVERRLAERRAPEAVERRRALAGRHSWAARAEQLVAVLDDRAAR
jgi:teichuronic acid biosynthesis glycosyltransferase TuaH